MLWLNQVEVEVQRKEFQDRGRLTRCGRKLRPDTAVAAGERRWRARDAGGANAATMDACEASIAATKSRFLIGPGMENPS
jgi:hypothetical protein